MPPQLGLPETPRPLKTTAAQPPPRPLWLQLATQASRDGSGSEYGCARAPPTVTPGRARLGCEQRPAAVAALAGCRKYSAAASAIIDDRDRVSLDQAAASLVSGTPDEQPRGCYTLTSDPDPKLTYKVRPPPACRLLKPFLTPRRHAERGPNKAWSNKRGPIITAKERKRTERARCCGIL